MGKRILLPVIVSVLILGGLFANIDVLGAAVEKTVEELCAKGGGPRVTLCAAIDVLTIENTQLTNDLADLSTLEVCDGIDNDADGTVDEVYSESTGSIIAVDDVCVTAENFGGTFQCDSFAFECLAISSAEICNGIDDDQDGTADEDFTNLNESCSVGVGQCQNIGIVMCSVDGSSAECSAVEGTPSPEILDGIDNDCDGITDNPELVDADGDGFSIADGDCNDFEATVNPDAPEIVGNFVDDNCNGQIDEGGFCGDDIVDIFAGEQCDDGNNINGDGCSAICTTE